MLLLMRYGAERLLYRIGQSRFADQFILKGATLFLVWYGYAYRATKDIDLLGIGNSDPERLSLLFRELCSQDTTDVDGLVFPADAVQVTTIQKALEFTGVRVTLRALLERVRIDLQVDIGFGDAAEPHPERITFPTLLEMPAPVIIAYQKYTVLAEKFMAIATLGMANSRMKDFYDICIMLRTMQLDTTVLTETIQATFKARNNALPKVLPAILADESLGNDIKIAQWNAFTHRSVLSVPIGEWSDVIAEIRLSMKPVFKKLGISEG